MSRRTAALAATTAAALAAATAALAPTGAAAAAPVAPARVPAAAVTPVSGAAMEALPAVDVDGLDMIPVVMGGVTNPDAASTSTPTISSYVWAIRQAGTRLFVGGMFLDVQQGADATPVRQPFLAAFDVATGAWDSSCRPTLDNAVYALAVSPTGDLVVGGEFTTVNGEERLGVVALDPQTCEVASLPTQVSRPYSTNPAIVRDLDVVGGKLYLAGSFSRVFGPDDSHTGVYKVARVDATTGALDRTWKPAVTGSGVWGLSVDAEHDRVHLAGWFSGVNGVSGSGNYTVVDGDTGASVTGLATRPRNSTKYPEVFDTETGDGVEFVGGSQHLLQTLDLDTGDQLGFSHTGYVGCGTDAFSACKGFGSGGDYQFAQRIGDTVFAGCHCTRGSTNGQNWHYNSVSGEYTTHHHVMAYDAATGALRESFRPDIDGAAEGSWAVASDTKGCLYVGGDYTKGGAAAGTSRFVSGIAKFCPEQVAAVASDSKAPTKPTRLEGVDIGDGAVQLAWTASTDNVGVARYQVTDATSGTTDTTGLLFTTATGLASGSHSFTVAAVDEAGNVGPTASVTVTVGAAGTDTASPTAPTGLTAVAAGTGATLNWAASTDAVGVKSYLVYRNGTYVGWSRTPGFADVGAPSGTTVTYQVRATDAAGNRSVRSEPVDVTLP